jgi:hypothetical protein
MLATVALVCNGTTKKKIAVRQDTSHASHKAGATWRTANDKEIIHSFSLPKMWKWISCVGKENQDHQSEDNSVVSPKN